MTIRRVYLTYTVVLAGLLLLLTAFSFGLQLFHHFRSAELNENNTKFRVLGVQGKFSNLKLG